MECISAAFNASVLNCNHFMMRMGGVTANLVKLCKLCYEWSYMKYCKILWDVLLLRVCVKSADTSSNISSKSASLTVIAIYVLVTRQTRCCCHLWVDSKGYSLVDFFFRKLYLATTSTNKYGDSQYGNSKKGIKEADFDMKNKRKERKRKIRN